MKKTILGLITLIAVLLIPITAYAAKENGTCDIMVHYSPFIQPVANDTFTLTFKDSKGNEQSFDFNASDMVEASGSFELPLGVYTIVELHYNGEGFIENYGYSVPAYFIVAEDNSKKPIEIALGHEEIKKMYEAIGEDSIIIYQNSMSFQKIEMLYSEEELPEEVDWDMHPGNDYIFYNGDILGDEESDYSEPSIDDMINNATDSNLDKASNDPQDITTTVAANEQTEEILPVIEQKTQEQTNVEPNINNDAHKKSLIARVAILGILVVLVAVLLLVLKKQGKI